MVGGRDESDGEFIRWAAAGETPTPTAGGVAPLNARAVESLQALRETMQAALKDARPFAFPVGFEERSKEPDPGDVTLQKHTLAPALAADLGPLVDHDPRLPLPTTPDLVAHNDGPSRRRVLGCPSLRRACGAGVRAHTTCDNAARVGLSLGSPSPRRRCPRGHVVRRGGSLVMGHSPFTEGLLEQVSARRPARTSCGGAIPWSVPWLPQSPEGLSSRCLHNAPRAHVV